MIEPKKHEGDMTAESAISILENIRQRVKFYDTAFPYMDREYCETLAGIDQAAIDKAIEAIRSQA